MLTTADIIAVITLLLTLATPLRASNLLLYEIMVTIIASLAVIPVMLSRLSDAMSGKALTAVILLNIILLFSQLPSTGVSIGEGAEMYRGMYITGHWSFSFAHNPAYNPFPAQVAQFVIMTKVLGLPWYSSLAWGIWYGLFIVIYDMVIYMLTLRLTQSKEVSILAAFFVGVTPETALTINPHLWLSNLFVIISTISLINAMEGINGLQNTISYVLSVLSLTTALLMLFIPISFIIAWYILNWLKIYKPMYTKTLPIRRNLILMLFAVYTIITLLVFLYTEGYFAYIYPMFINLNNAIWQLLTSFFMKRNVIVSNSTQYHFLYNEANPILAYAWSLAISIAASYLLYIILRKRRENIWLMTLLITGLTIPIIATVQRLFTTTYPISVNAYTAIPLIFPIAGLTLAQLKNKNKVILTLLIILLIAVVPIAAQDPSISPIEYAKIHHYNVPPITKSEYIDTMLLNSLLSSNTIYIYSPVMGTLSWYTPSLGWVGAYPTNVIAQALPVIRFILNESNVNIYIVVYNGTLNRAYYVTLGQGIPPTIVYNKLNNPNILYNSKYIILVDQS